MAIKISLPTKHTQNKAKQSKTQKPTIIHKKEQDNLYGTGITKRKAEQAERDIESQNQQAYKFQNEHGDEIENVINLHLPSTLVDENLILDEFQQAAVDGIRHEQYACLIGQAGVGKTTVIKNLVNESVKNLPIIDLNLTRLENHQTKNQDLNVAMAFCSFMGKAVQQIKRALPEEYHPLCQTIHALLGYHPEYETRTDEKTGDTYDVKVFRPFFTSHNKLPYKEIKIDEAGSVPIYLWNELISALNDDCKITLIGDLNQLPPVTGRSVLGFAITKWPTFVLSKIHRQAADNPIIANADRIIHGKKPLKDTKKFVIQTIPDGSFAAFQHATAVVQKLHKGGIFDPLRDAFIVPQNKDELGQIAFNEKLVRYFNPTKKIEGIAINPPIVITAGYLHVTYAVGDKIMILSNDRELGLTNGMIGIVKEIKPNVKFKGEAIAEQSFKNISASEQTLDLSNLREEIAKESNTVDEVEETERQASHTLIAEFQNVDEPIEFQSAGSYRKITHAYAMTGHKSQGSEYPTVVILVHSANLIMLTREWLYTTVTRAQERVVLLTNHRGLTHAVNRQLLKGKTIQEKAERFNAIQKAANGDTSLPNLPEPRKV